MIAYIKGALISADETSVVLETGGIGYRVYVTSALTANLPPIGDEIKLHTHMNIKDDGITLFGFRHTDELTVFKSLITVSGVGPKAAMAFLSQLGAAEVMSAIAAGDAAALAVVSGVGKKTAQKVILELKDKFKNADLIYKSVTQETLPSFNEDFKEEVLEALVSLGYGKAEAIKAVNKAAASNAVTSSTLLKEALKVISSN